MLYYSVCGPRVKYLSFKCLCKIYGTCQLCQVVLKARETKNKSVCFDFDIFTACLGSKLFTRTEDFSSTQTFWRVTCFILVCHTYIDGRIVPLHSLIAAIPDMSADANGSRNHFVTKENGSCSSELHICLPQACFRHFNL